MNKYLNRPFPFIDKIRYQIIASFLFGLFIYVFLSIFQPFGISNITLNKPLYLLGFAFITFIVLFISFVVVYAYYKTENWTIKKNTQFIFVQFLIIAILNWLYHSSIIIENTTHHNFLYFVFITVAVGIIPTFFLLYFIEKYLTVRNQGYAINLTNSIQEGTFETKIKEIQIISKNKDESIIISSNQFVCAQSEGNYIKVFYKEKDKIITKLIRNSIANLEEQLAIYSKLKRCHRSFIINFGKVDKVTGNARNFNLHVNELEFTIPVSRNFPKKTIYELIK